MSDSPLIAITGASGLIGRALCAYLGSRGFTILALARRADHSLRSLPHVTIFACDLPDAIPAEALAGCCAVLHAAYVTRFRNIDDARTVNEIGTLRLLELSHQARVPRFVFISSASAHAEARSYYGQSKFRLESAFDQARDLVIRPGFVLSAYGGLVGRMLGHSRRTWNVPIFRGGRQRIQTIHIDDLCEGFLLALRGGMIGTLALAEINALPIREFFRLLAARVKRPIRFIPAPIGPTLLTLRIAERLGIRLPISSENLLGLLSARVMNTAPDLQRLGLRIRSAQESLASLPLSQP